MAKNTVLCADGKPRIFVSGITEGSVADIDGRIRVNDQIIAVSFVYPYTIRYIYVRSEAEKMASLV